jgi:hypothetical protein
MKTQTDPMQSPSSQPEALRAAPRCGARTRSGFPCRSPAVAGRRRCRMHGGSAGSGGPMGERNGAYRTGAFTKGAIAERRQLAALLVLVRATLRSTT